MTTTTRSAVSRRMTPLEQLRAERRAWRAGQLLVGLVGYGASLSVLLGSVLGSASWNVLSQGLSRMFDVTFGEATTVTSFVVLLFWIPLRELPGLGTVLNVALVGVSADVVNGFLPTAQTLPAQIGYLVAGLLMLAFFDAVYLGARFGAGPRDGLMTGAVRVTGRPVWLVRGAIELAVVGAGWALGGTAGPGTLLIALATGPLVQMFLRVTTVRLAWDDAPAAPDAEVTDR